MSFLTQTTRRLLHTTRRCLVTDETSRIKRQIHEIGAIIPPNEFKYVTTPKTVEIIGAPMTAGQPLLGTDSGPQLIRSLGLSGRLATLGWRVSDADDLEFPAPGPNDDVIEPSNGNAKNSIAVGHGNKILCHAIDNANQLGRFPLVVGGDHSIGFASVAAALRHNPDTSILWVDAHAGEFENFLKNFEHF